MSLNNGAAIRAKSLDVSPEEIAQAHERPDGLDIRGWFSVFNSFEFILARFYPFWSEREAQVGDFFVSENTFFKVNLQVVFVQACQNLIQDL